MRSFFRLYALAALASVAVACGGDPDLKDTRPRDGGDIDVISVDAENDALDDTNTESDSLVEDTGVVEPDTAPAEDTGVLDTGSDTGTDSLVTDTLVADTLVTDTLVADTFVPPMDSGTDTFVADTFVPPMDSGTDTFVADTFVPPMDSGTDTFVPDTFMPSVDSGSDTFVFDSFVPPPIDSTTTSFDSFVDDTEVIDLDSTTRLDADGT